MDEKKIFDLLVDYSAKLKFGTMKNTIRYSIIIGACVGVIFFLLGANYG